jgi:hypothetical protein
MSGFKVLILLMCIAFTAIPGVQAEDRWQLKSISEFNIALWRKADSSGLGIYLIRSGGVWLVVKLPKGTEKVDLSRPFELRVDRSEAFSSPESALQPDPTAVAWQIAAPESAVVKGSLLDRLMKGNLAHVRCHVIGGRAVKMTVPLKGSKSAIERLLSMRP